MSAVMMHSSASLWNVGGEWLIPVAEGDTRQGGGGGYLKHIQHLRLKKNVSRDYDWSWWKFKGNFKGKLKLYLVSMGLSQDWRPLLEGLWLLLGSACLTFFPIANVISTQDIKIKRSSTNEMMSVFCAVTLYGLVDRDQRFGVTYCPHLQDITTQKTSTAVRTWSILYESNFSSNVSLFMAKRAGTSNQLTFSRI